MRNGNPLLLWTSHRVNGGGQTPGGKRRADDVDQ